MSLFSTTKQAITSFVGLLLFLGMARSLGLEKKMNALGVKERERGYKPAESVFTLMGLLQAGGVALDDASLLKGDEGDAGVAWGIAGGERTHRKAICLTLEYWDLYREWKETPRGFKLSTDHRT